MLCWYSRRLQKAKLLSSTPRALLMRGSLLLALALQSANAWSEPWIDWHSPFHIDGFSLNEEESEIYKRLGAPVSCRMLGPDRKIQWIYPRHSFVFEGWKTCGVSGPEVSQNDQSLAQAGKPNSQFTAQVGAVDSAYEGYRFFPYSQVSWNKYLPGYIEHMLRVRYQAGKQVSYEIENTPSYRSFDEPDQASTQPILPAVAPVLVNLETTIGPIDLELYREAEPESVDRIVSLVKSGFYDKTPFFEILPACRASFGVNSRAAYRPEKNRRAQRWASNRFRIEAGTVALSGSTSLTVNLQDLNDGPSPPLVGRVTNGLKALRRLPALNVVHSSLDLDGYWDNSDGRPGPYILSAKVAPETTAHRNQNR